MTSASSDLAASSVSSLVATFLEQTRLAFLMGTFLEDIFYDRQGGEGIGPTCVESQVRNNFPGLFPSQPIVHRPVEVVRDLRDLGGSNQSAHRDQTSISGSKARA